MSMRRNTGRDRRGGGTLAFSPASIVGVTNWWDAARGVTIVTGVSQWDDQIGGKNFTQGTGAAQPTFTASATTAGTPAVDCDTSSKLMTNSAMTSMPSAAYTIVMVVKVAASSNNFWGHTNAGATTGLRLDSNSTKFQLIALAPTVLSGNFTWDSSYHVVTFAIAASGGFGAANDTIVHEVDGVTKTVTGGPGVFTQGTSTIRFGGVTAVPKIAEMIVANGTVLSAGDRATLQAYLKAKHGTP
jgi:hypothetical protein